MAVKKAKNEQRQSVTNKITAPQNKIVTSKAPTMINETTNETRKKVRKERIGKSENKAKKTKNKKNTG